MSKNLFRFLGAAGLGLLLLGVFAMAADADKDAAHRFKVTIASKLNMEIGNQKKQIGADTEFVYA